MKATEEGKAMKAMKEGKAVKDGKDKKIITGKTKLGEILENYPQSALILAEKYQLHCVGCFAAAFETVEEGGFAHGMSKKEIREMILVLNEAIKPTKPKAKAGAGKN